MYHFFFIFHSTVRGRRACVYNCVEVVRRFVQIFRKTSPAILVTRVEKRRKNVDGASKPYPGVSLGFWIRVSFLGYAHNEIKCEKKK